MPGPTTMTDRQMLCLELQLHGELPRTKHEWEQFYRWLAGFQKLNPEAVVPKRPE